MFSIFKKKSNLEYIIVSNTSTQSDDIYAIIQSNITFINLLIEEGLSYDQCNKNAVTSYFIDYYLAQMNNGAFAQYIYNIKNNISIHKIVEDGLDMIGATKHLQLFKKQMSLFDNLTNDQKNLFFQSQLFGENTIRDTLNVYTSEFFDVSQKENLIQLNHNFLINNSELKPLSIDKMYEAAESIVGKKISRT